MIIDDWAGPESGLYLGRMEADLERFRISGEESHTIYPCSGLVDSQEQQHPQQPQQYHHHQHRRQHQQLEYEYNTPANTTYIPSSGSANLWWGAYGAATSRSSYYAAEEYDYAKPPPYVYSDTAMFQRP